ncbi:hypothetical protein [Campylobacter concisus]|uniref:hypothetical protein n=1 Tax=Campylobacter concisus TaxID=199 RepID=UPI003D2471D3
MGVTIFYNALSFFLTQKPPTSRNLTPKNPSKFQTRFRDFYNITFRTKKAKFTDLFNNKNLKGYEILVVKFMQKFTD